MLVYRNKFGSTKLLMRRPHYEFIFKRSWHCGLQTHPNVFLRHTMSPTKSTLRRFIFLCLFKYDLRQSCDFISSMLFNWRPLSYTIIKLHCGLQSWKPFINHLRITWHMPFVPLSKLVYLFNANSILWNWFILMSKSRKLLLHLWKYLRFYIIV